MNHMNQRTVWKANQLYMHMNFISSFWSLVSGIKLYQVLSDQFSQQCYQPPVHVFCFKSIFTLWRIYIQLLWNKKYIWNYIKNIWKYKMKYIKNIQKYIQNIYRENITELSESTKSQKIQQYKTTTWNTNIE